MTVASLPRMDAHGRTAGWPAIGIVASTFAVAMAATTVITPLYPGYVAEFGLSSLEVTIVFAAYGAAVMLGLALFGRLSDHYGRKPPLGAALCVAIASMAVFLLAQGHRSAAARPGADRADRRCLHGHLHRLAGRPDPRTACGRRRSRSPRTWAGSAWARCLPACSPSGRRDRFGSCTPWSWCCWCWA